MAANAIPNGQGNDTMHCPNDHGKMKLTKEERLVSFRGVDLEIEAEVYKCPVCNVTAGTIEQGGQAQKALTKAYQKKVGLLTSDEIRACRSQMGHTQQELADKIGVGVASIRRWEGGLAQTPAMDKLLRSALNCGIDIGDPFTGNRKPSLERTKLVIKEFEKKLGSKLLLEGDRMLYTAKYVFYADMKAFSRLGKSMTGANYAALPHGPQINNYRELADLIYEADEDSAEPLSQGEKEIIAKIAKTFPNKADVYHASHREKVVLDKSPGHPIYYSEADMLTEI